MLVLLHVCCGPCASACVPALRERGEEMLLYFANSNLDTREEYERRLEAARQLAAAEGVKLVAAPYDHESWLREVAVGHEHDPEKGERCQRCYRYNLALAAAFAQAQGIGAFTTSLSVSPHKPSKAIFAAGHDAEKTIAIDRVTASSGNPQFLEIDFKKRDGFLTSVRRTRELGLYRQGYCGCEFSAGDGMRQ